MNFSKIGYILGVSATALILLWIGALKFTAAEASAIKPYVANSFIMFWLYSVTSLQGASNVIGIFEITTAGLLLGSFFNPVIGKIAGYAAAVIFICTLSFLVTTPGIWKLSNGIPVTDFFVVKDLAFLAITLMVIGENSRNKSKMAM